MPRRTVPRKPAPAPEGEAPELPQPEPGSFIGPPAAFMLHPVQPAPYVSLFSPVIELQHGYNDGKADFLAGRQRPGAPGVGVFENEHYAAGYAAGAQSGGPARLTFELAPIGRGA